MRPFVPKPGDFVRVVAIAPFDTEPGHRVGDRVEAWIAVRSKEHPEWIILDCDTYCQVELIEAVKP